MFINKKIFYDMFINKKIDFLLQLTFYKLSNNNTQDQTTLSTL